MQHVLNPAYRKCKICETIDMLAYSQDKAVLDTLGVKTSSFSSSESSDEGSDYSDSESLKDNSETMPDNSQVLSESNFNWFEFHENIERMIEHCDSNNISKTLENFFLKSHIWVWALVKAR